MLPEDIAVLQKKTNLEGNTSGYAGDENDAPRYIILYHHPARALRCEQDTVDVDRQDLHTKVDVR